MPGFLMSTPLWLLLMRLLPVLGSNEAVGVAAACDEMQPVMCTDNSTWHQQLRALPGPVADPLGSGRVCDEVCEEVTVYFDSGWKATDIAVHSFLADTFQLKVNRRDSVKGSGDEKLHTFNANLELTVFFFDAAGQKHGFTEFAGRISELPPSLDNTLTEMQRPKFVVVGPSFVRKLRMAIHFTPEGTAVVVQCSPTLADVLRGYGSYRDELVEEVCHKKRDEL
mmetsp:Transcript_52985/g.113151  ORF Transcript_52985/g.113151 Transcript_52985/m.113151 type:complete len:224 (-) Transcript_52985:156-827(-)